MSNEVIATRRLVVRSLDQEATIEVRIYKPVQVQNDWAAVFEIDAILPDGGVYRHQGMQVDSFGALIQAVDLVNSKLRSIPLFSSMHWLEDGDECGLKRLSDRLG